MLLSVCPSYAFGLKGEERKRVWCCVRWGDNEVGDIRLLKGGNLRVAGRKGGRGERVLGRAKSLNVLKGLTREGGMDDELKHLLK